MTQTRSLPIILVALLAVTAYAALVMLPAAEHAEQGRVLAFMRIEGAEAGFSNTTTFRVDETYDRIGLSYVITEAAHVRASVTAPDGSVHDAQPVHVGGGQDRLELNVRSPMQGTWEFIVRTLDEPGRTGYIVAGDFYVLGFGGETTPP